MDTRNIVENSQMFNNCESEETLVKVVADTVSSREIKFECPFCYRRYNKNGEPRKNGSQITHIHHSGGDLSNREVFKNPHCIQNYIKGTSNFPKDKDGFLIQITPETKRIYNTTSSSNGMNYIDDLQKRKTQALMRQYYPNLVKC